VTPETMVLAARALERIVIVGGAVFAIYLGYRLYLHGISKGGIRWEASGTLIPKLLLTGTGPGLAFMAFGALVLMLALMKGPSIDNDNEVTEHHLGLVHPSPPCSTPEAQAPVAGQVPSTAAAVPTVTTTTEEQDAGGGGGGDGDEDDWTKHSSRRRHIKTLR
jgi:hypothetical protein